MEEILFFAVTCHQFNQLFTAPGADEIAQGFVINREEAGGGAIFRGHVGNRRPIGQAELGHARAVEFDKLADNALLAQHLRDA